MSRHQSIALITMGDSPQNVLQALDYLFSAGDPPDRLHLLFFEAHIQRSKADYLSLLDCLGSDSRLSRLLVEKHQLSLETKESTRPAGRQQILAADRQQTLDAAYLWEPINRLVTGLKMPGTRLNIVVGEDHMLLGMLLMTAANLHFYPQDKLWQQSADERLIQLPVMPLGSLFMELRSLPSHQLVQMVPDPQMEQNCRTVWGQLTRRQRDVLQEFAKGKRPAEVAQALSLTLATVDSHKAQIFKVVRDVWQMEPDARLDYRFLHETFGHFDLV